VADVLEHLHAVLVVERRVAGHHLVDQHAQRPPAAGTQGCPRCYGRLLCIWPAVRRRRGRSRLHSASCAVAQRRRQPILRPSLRSTHGRWNAAHVMSTGASARATGWAPEGLGCRPGWAAPVMSACSVLAYVLSAHTRTLGSKACLTGRAAWRTAPAWAGA